MDVILDTGLVNWFLGGVYSYTAAVTCLLIWKIKKATPVQYKIMAAKRRTFLWYLCMIMATCGTVAYQNFSGDFSEYLLWWRLGLISTIAVLTTSMCVYSKSVMGVVPNDV